MENKSISNLLAKVCGIYKKESEREAALRIIRSAAKSDYSEIVSKMSPSEREETLRQATEAYSKVVGD